MNKKYRNRAQENSRVIRIPLATYAELQQLAAQAQVSIGQVVEALAKLEPVKKKQEEVPKVSPAQMPMPIQTLARSTPVTISFSREVESDIRYRQTNGH